MKKKEKKTYYPGRDSNSEPLASQSATLTVRPCWLTQGSHHLLTIYSAEVRGCNRNFLNLPIAKLNRQLIEKPSISERFFAFRSFRTSP